jgi:TolA-binding protein
MRKDAISEDALKNAYLIFREKGHQTLDFTHESTDYFRGTVLEPQNTSVVDNAYDELYPTSRQSRQSELEQRGHGIEDQIERVQEKIRMSRLQGNFQALQTQLKELAALTKEKSRIDAAAAVNDLGAAQTNQYEGMMGYSESVDLDQKIASLESRIRDFVERRTNL